MAQSERVELAPGSIEEVAARLMLWCRRAPRGFARVEFTSEFARQSAEQNLRDALGREDIAFHSLSLSVGKPPSEIIRDLLDRLDQLPPGVVSLTGFATAFPDSIPVEDSLRLLNFNRENLVRPHLRQIWWMTPAIAEKFVNAVPDLDSWFMVRLRLTEVVTQERDKGIEIGAWTSPSNREELLRRAESLMHRFEEAKRSNFSKWEQFPLLFGAIIAFYEAGALREAEGLADEAAHLISMELKDLESNGEWGLIVDLEKRTGISTYLNFLGYYYHRMGRLAEAESLLRRALSLRENVLGPDHPDTATSLNNLAELFRTQGRLTEAEPIYRQVVDTLERVLGPDHPETATSFNNLALLYQDQGRLAEAEQLYRRALLIRENILGPHHPETAQSLNNLALLYHSQGRLTEAESLHSRALSIRENTLGLDHPDTANSLDNLASLYSDQGRHNEAESLLKRALPIWEKNLGPDHPDTATSLNNLAVLYYSRGQLDKAESLYRRALKIYEKALGDSHPQTATAYGNYAALLQALNREEEALQMKARAEAIRARHAALNTRSEPEGGAP